MCSGKLPRVADDSVQVENYQPPMVVYQCRLMSRLLYYIAYLIQTRCQECIWIEKNKTIRHFLTSTDKKVV